jgi:hypothetical protein
VSLSHKQIEQIDARKKAKEDARGQRGNDAKRGNDAAKTLPVVTAFSVVADSLLAEEIYVPAEDPPFQYAKCILDGDGNGDPYTTCTFEDSGNQYCPPGDTNDMIKKRDVLLPSAAVPYTSDAELFADLLCFIHRYCDIDPFWERLMAVYAMMTWIVDRLDTVPYLRFLGGPDSGKTRLAETVAYLCYRTIKISGGSSPAFLYRSMNIFRGTLFIDEADSRGELWSDLSKIVNAGYHRGTSIGRCDQEGNPETFDPFGPKVFSVREKFGDSATDTRCLTLNTYKKETIRPGVPLNLPPDTCTFYAEAEVLRNQLLTWRFRNYRRIEITPAI